MFSSLLSPFHLVKISAWPIFRSVGGLGITFGGIIWWYKGRISIFILSILLIIIILTSWFGKVKSENLEGFHNRIVVNGFRIGMVLFIFSEVLFFFSFFWRFFYKCWGSLYWPPPGFKKIVIDPFSIPLLNTVILLSSGVSITWAHHRLIKGGFKKVVKRLIITSLLGFYFLVLQINEYQRLFVFIKRQNYGRVFFMLTGFHGFHVLIGCILLLICLGRQCLFYNSSGNHIGFELSSWYWHFVDVVWLFLYFFVYWVGGVI